MASRRLSQYRPTIVVGLVALCLLLSALQGVGKLQSVSTDGEATVYFRNDFSGTFDLVYNVTLKPAPSNRAWTGVSVLLLGEAWPGSSVSVGMSRGYPKPGNLASFTTSAAPRAQSKYTTFPVHCQTCLIELRGDDKNIYASIDGHGIAMWSRKTFPITKPYVQMNAEVTTVGDELSATFQRVRAEVNGKALPAPRCAFTTQGIEAGPLRGGTITFSGTRRVDARVTYVSLQDGSTGDECPRSTPQGR